MFFLLWGLRSRNSDSARRGLATVLESQPKRTLLLLSKLQVRSLLVLEFRSRDLPLNPHDAKTGSPRIAV